jgi:hypothetical protein
MIDNPRDGSRLVDSIDMSALAPMRLGPVAHGRSYDLTMASNLDFYGRYSKVYECDLGGPHGGPGDTEGVDPHKEPSPAWTAARIIGFSEGWCRSGGSPYAFTVVITADGHEHHATEVEARSSYYTWYERLVRDTDEFAALRELMARGADVVFVGRGGDDAGPADLDYSDISEQYEDPSTSFNHATALSAMLTLDPADYPWRIAARAKGWTF